MGERNKDLGWRPTMLFALVACLVLLAYNLWPNWVKFCPTDEQAKLALCSREWIGALSGWAAAIAAAITIVFLYRQNDEQKRQTQFLLGDAQPTMDAIQHIKRRIHVVVRVVNWNRRPIIVHALSVLPKRGDLDITLAQIWDRDVPSNNLSSRKLIGDRIHPAIAMHGWKDRSQAPCEVRLDVALDNANTMGPTSWAGSEVFIEVIVAGEESQRLTLRCPIADAQRDGDLELLNFDQAE